MASAERELVLVSPYFVPTDAGIDMFIELVNRGVDVTIITNSLAANNQLTVHGAYAKSRKPLLEAGVAIHEVRRDATMMGAEYTQSEMTRTTLHTKGFIVDDREFFIGSFNFDPRSAYINTELGVIIYDQGLARFYARMVDDFLPERTYAVFLDDGKLRWRTVRNGETVVYEKEPDTSWGQRFLAKLIGWLPLEKQL
jgi:putative cardiolipin synthase